MIRFQPTSCARPTGVARADCRTTLTRRLAEDMREMAFAGEAVNRETLEQRGWTKAAIARLGGRAVEMARRASIRQIGGEP